MQNSVIITPIIMLLGGISMYTASVRPIRTEMRDMIVLLKTKSRNDRAQLRTLTVGITRSAPISNPPTVFIPIHTLIARRQKIVIEHMMDVNYKEQDTVVAVLLQVGDTIVSIQHSLRQKPIQA